MAQDDAAREPQIEGLAQLRAMEEQGAAWNRDVRRATRLGQPAPRAPFDMDEYRRLQAAHPRANAWLRAHELADHDAAMRAAAQRALAMVESGDDPDDALDVLREATQGYVFREPDAGVRRLYGVPEGGRVEPHLVPADMQPGELLTMVISAPATPTPAAHATVRVAADDSADDDAPQGVVEVAEATVRLPKGYTVVDGKVTHDGARKAAAPVLTFTDDWYPAGYVMFHFGDGDLLVLPIDGMA